MTVEKGTEERRSLGNGANYAAASDIVRVAVLYCFGGFYRTRIFWIFGSFGGFSIEMRIFWWFLGANLSMISATKACCNAGKEDASAEL